MHARAWIYDIPDELARRAIKATVRNLVETSSGEGELQQFLTEHPWILLSTFVPPWPPALCFPKFKLGNEFETDFLIVTGVAGCTNCVLVEIEPPNQAMFTKAGVPADRTRQALKQITDWHGWIDDNRDFFRMEVLRAIRKSSAFQTTSADDGAFWGALDPKLFPEWWQPPDFKVITGRRKEKGHPDNKKRRNLSEMHKHTAPLCSWDRLIDAVF